MILYTRANVRKCVHVCVCVYVCCVTDLICTLYLHCVCVGELLLAYGHGRADILEALTRVSEAIRIYNSTADVVAVSGERSLTSGYRSDHDSERYLRLLTLAAQAHCRLCVEAGQSAVVKSTVTAVASTISADGDSTHSHSTDIVGADSCEDHMRQARMLISEASQLASASKAGPDTHHIGYGFYNYGQCMLLAGQRFDAVESFHIALHILKTDPSGGTAADDVISRIQAFISSAT
jgi:hypothetical protein